MIPSKGSYVKVYLKNGFIDEGIVEDWQNNIICLSNEQSYSIITDPNEIFLVKVMKEKFNTKQESPKVFVEKEPEPTEYHRDPNLRAASLAELHKKRVAEEQANARRALTEFKANNRGYSTEYGKPGLGRREKSIFIDPAKKDR